MRRQIGDCTLYLGDCREIMPTLHSLDVVITDPPYPDIAKDFSITPIDFLADLTCRQLVFWSAVEEFPLLWSAIHIWHKPNGNSSHHYERIFELNGKKLAGFFGKLLFCLIMYSIDMSA